MFFKKITLPRYYIGQGGGFLLRFVTLLLKPSESVTSPYYFKGSKGLSDTSFKRVFNSLSNVISFVKFGLIVFDIITKIIFSLLRQKTTSFSGGTLSSKTEVQHRHCMGSNTAFMCMSMSLNIFILDFVKAVFGNVRYCELKWFTI